MTPKEKLKAVEFLREVAVTLKDHDLGRGVQWRLKDIAEKLEDEAIPF